MGGSGRARRVVVLGFFFFVVGAALLAALFGLSNPADATASPVLDHFECYTGSAIATTVAPKPFANTPPKVLVKNKFTPAGFVVAPGAVQLHCNPVQKTVVSGGKSVTTPITNADAHLVCRAISATGLNLPASVTLRNQFGSGTLQPTGVGSLCVPSWKTETTPLKFPSSVAPPNLDAFVCYTAVHPALTPGFKPPSSVALQDQFGALTTKVGAAKMLCLPSSETAKPGTTPPIVNPNGYAVCYGEPASKSVAARTVYDKNAFGIGAVKVTVNSLLCVPSTKVAVIPTTTTEPTTTTTAPGVVTNYTFASVSGAYDIDAGSDGALWFSNYFGNSIGRITTDGTITNYPDPSIMRPDGVAKGPDGAMWFANTGGNSIGRVTPDGVFSSYPDARIASPYRVAAGPGPAVPVMWFTSGAANSVGNVTIAGQVTAYPSFSISNPQGITAGPDGAMWFANFYGSGIGRITVDGHLSMYNDGTVVAPLSITTGPDGALWFTNAGNNTIGRITTDGKISHFANSTIASPIDIVTGSDHALWFTNYSNNTIGRITVNGDVSNYGGDGISYPDGIAAGPDGAIWFTNSGNDSIGRISV